MYTTTSMGEAAWLLTQGYKMLGVSGNGFKTFFFPEECAEIARGYYSNAPAPVRSFHENLMNVRRAIHS